MRSFIHCALLIALAASCLAQVPRPPQASSTPAEDPTTTFKVDVKLVNVFVTVTDLTVN